MKLKFQMTKNEKQIVPKHNSRPRTKYHSLDIWALDLISHLGLDI